MLGVWFLQDGASIISPRYAKDPAADSLENSRRIVKRVSKVFLPPRHLMLCDKETSHLFQEREVIGSQGV